MGLFHDLARATCRRCGQPLKAVELLATTHNPVLGRSSESTRCRACNQRHRLKGSKKETVLKSVLIGLGFVLFNAVTSQLGLALIFRMLFSLMFFAAVPVLIVRLLGIEAVADPAVPGEDETAS